MSLTRQHFIGLPYCLIGTKCQTQLSYLQICTADGKQTWRSFSRYYRVDFDLKNIFADHYYCIYSINIYAVAQ